MIGGDTTREGDKLHPEPQNAVRLVRSSGLSSNHLQGLRFEGEQATASMVFYRRMEFWEG
jgi:hypothetical protein